MFPQLFVYIENSWFEIFGFDKVARAISLLVQRTLDKLLALSGDASVVCPNLLRALELWQQPQFASCRIIVQICRKLKYILWG